ncbi:DUF4333 domain-containing protein [Mycolicibacterium sp. 141076]|uniref:DUF4333 domain-containing protein n=1 Tax=Mycobacteriaceae TaxID=1762 RepID=UPI00299F4D7E|nr:DUF4333 domain-containing protein [Mycolicibacterium sp. 141076]MDX1879773.1 DUF4333 domain-containing protein [Mycolicibacterium sp. 141076]
MNDNTSNTENATSRITQPQREPSAPANQPNHDELPWWQTIYQPPPGSFHNIPQRRPPMRPVRPFASPRSSAIAPRARPASQDARLPPPIPQSAPVGPPVGPAQRGPASSTARLKHQSNGRRKLIGIGAAVLAVEAVALLVGISMLRTSKTIELDINQAQRGVEQVLTDTVSGYGVTNISNVRCNGGVNPPVKKDGTFKCEATVDGRQRQITVVFVDDGGTYEVGGPTG